jgi:DNA replication protein DnaC
MAFLRRVLDKDDLTRVNLPIGLWKSDPSRIQGDARAKVHKYLTDIDDHIRNGRGLYIHGGPGVGKSSVAAVAAMVVKSIGSISVYFTTLWELIRDVKDQKDFQAEMSVLERCRSVDMLILDGVKEQDFKDSFFFNANDIVGLLESRTMRSKLTLMTSELAPIDLPKRLPSNAKDLLLVTRMIPLRVEGKDLRAQRITQDEALLGGPSGSR